MDQLLKMLLIAPLTLAALFPDLSAQAATGAAYGAIGAAIVILRALTLFYAVALGFVFIAVTGRVFHRQVDWEELEHVKR